MNKRYSLICFLILLSLLCLGGEEQQPQPKDFPADVAVYKGEPGTIDFSSDASARQFRTRLREGIQKGANFAGAYTLIRWGCGTACNSYCVVHTQSGRIVGWGTACENLSFSLESRLIIENPPDPAIPHPLCPPVYIVLENETLKELKQAPAQE